MRTRRDSRGRDPIGSTSAAGSLPRRGGSGRPNDRHRIGRSLGVESLESRIVLSTAKAALGPVLGTISGHVINTAGKGLRHIQVQLIDSSGAVQAKQFTNAKGDYNFKIRADGAYVVREVTPKKYVQLAPTFAGTKPVGALLPGYTNASWNYKSGNNDPTNGMPVGPANWNTIAPAGNQPFESPINIQGPATDLGQVLSVNYGNTVPTHEVNTGYQVQVASTTTDSLTLNGQQFELSQFHYHDPAENTVNGTTYPMEEHFVNVSSAGAETVLGVFLQLGPHNSALDPILNAALTYLDKTPAGTSTPGSNVGTINFAGLLPPSMMGWYFEGSLTTPPLSQVVNWLVFSTPITMDATQLAEYQLVANDNGYLPNARPVQPLDGRQLNEIDFDDNFQGSSITALTFVDGPAGSSTAAVRGGTHANAAGSASAPTRASERGSRAMAATLPVLQANPALQAAAAAQNYQPVAGCNCPLCQMLRNAVWHQVTPNSSTQNVGAALAGSSAAASGSSGASQAVTIPTSAGGNA